MARTPATSAPRPIPVRRGGVMLVASRALAIVGLSAMIAAAHWWGTPVRLKAGEGRETVASGPATPPPVRPAETAPPTETVPDEPVQPEADDYGAQLAAWLDGLPIEIGTEASYRMWDENLAFFIDARPAEEYGLGHIPGAFNVPPRMVSRGGLSVLLQFMGPDDRVVIYCEGGTCDASHLVAIQLEELGLTKIHIDADGYPGWVNAGHESEDGPDMLLGGEE